MPDTSRNPLADLAERLKFHAEVAESGHALDDHASIDLDDAYRIVAEPAKRNKSTATDCPSDA